MSKPSGADETAAAAHTAANTSINGGEPPVPERRFTAPSSFDAGETEIIGAVQEPATEVMPVSKATASATAAFGDTEAFPQTNAAPQAIPARTRVGKPRRRRSNWGWVIALILVIAALVALAVLGTVLLTHDDSPKVSQEDLVRTTIENFDGSIQKGDLATLRSISCGETADDYGKYDDAKWTICQTAS